MVVVVMVVMRRVTFRVALALPAGRDSISRCGYKLEAVVGHHGHGAGRGGAWWRRGRCPAAPAGVAARVAVVVVVVVMAARLVVLGARDGEGNGGEGSSWGGPGKGQDFSA